VCVCVCLVCASCLISPCGEALSAGFSSLLSTPTCGPPLTWRPRWLEWYADLVLLLHTHTFSTYGLIYFSCFNPATACNTQYTCFRIIYIFVYFKTVVNRQLYTALNNSKTTRTVKTEDLKLSSTVCIT